MAVLTPQSLGKGRYHFQRYEFLGDAVLNFSECARSACLTAVSLNKLWDEYPLATNAGLTVAKHSRVSNVSVPTGCADHRAHSWPLSWPRA